MNGTTAAPAADAVDCPRLVHPPAAYPVPLTISVPAADAEDVPEFSRSFIADAASTVNAPGIPAAPVGVSAFRTLLILRYHLSRPSTSPRPRPRTRPSRSARRPRPRGRAGRGPATRPAGRRPARMRAPQVIRTPGGAAAPGCRSTPNSSSNTCVNESSTRMIVLPPASTTWPSGSRTPPPLVRLPPRQHKLRHAYQVHVVSAAIWGTLGRQAGHAHSAQFCRAGSGRARPGCARTGTAPRAPLPAAFAGDGEAGPVRDVLHVPNWVSRGSSPATASSMLPSHPGQPRATIQSSIT